MSEQPPDGAEPDKAPPSPPSPPPTPPSSVTPSKSRGFPFIAGLIAVVLSAVLVLGVLKTGQVDKYLVGALVVLALAFSGYGGDRLLERYFESKKGG